MAALPYIQFYPADYLADTRHLTLEEHGAYLMLILNYWQTGNPLRADAQRMARICSTSVENWSKIKPLLVEFFTEETDKESGNIVWIHQRIEYDLLKVLNKSTKASRAGKQSAKSRAAKRLENKGNPTNVVDPYQQNGNHTDTDTDTDTDINHPTGGSKKVCPAGKIVELYHKILPTLPACLKLTTARRAMIRQRHIEDMEQDLETWEEYFQLVSRSPFLMGASPPRNGSAKPFTATLDWICKAENFAKIYEGKYHG